MSNLWEYMGFEKPVSPTYSGMTIEQLLDELDKVIRAHQSVESGDTVYDPDLQDERLNHIQQIKELIISITPLGVYIDA